MSDDRDRQETETVERIRRNDRTLFEVPLFGGHPISVNEVHAMKIGVGTGLVTGFLYALGTVIFTFPVDDVFPIFLYVMASAIVTTLVGYAVVGSPMFRSSDHDSEEDPLYPVGIKTIRHEPWYFLAVYLVASTVAFGILFGVGMWVTGGW